MLKMAGWFCAGSLVGGSAAALLLLLMVPAISMQRPPPVAAAAEAPAAVAAVVDDTLPAGHDTAASQTASAAAPTAPVSTPAAADAALRGALAALRTAVDGGRRERAVLIARLDGLDDELTRLRRQLRRGGSAAPAVSERGTLTGERLLEAGFSAADAEYLSQRWGERAMELMYLRDQARREGWLNSARYREQRRAIRDRYALDEELGDEDYERFLYASGAPNRVEVVGVFAASPAEAAGLRPGDVILSYGETVVRNGGELRSATEADEPGAPTPLLVDRNGSRLVMELPRGPIGVRTRDLSVLP